MFKGCFKWEGFWEMAPLFVVQEIPDCNIPKKMEIYKEKNRQKNSEGNKKVTGCYVHASDQMVFATWLEADSGLSIGRI